jgi:hypothetical protein
LSEVKEHARTELSVRLLKILVAENIINNAESELFPELFEISTGTIIPASDNAILIQYIRRTGKEMVDFIKSTPPAGSQISPEKWKHYTE